jgi:hypothetical protein
MTVVRVYNTPILLTTVLVLVLSVLACSGSYLTTVPTTPPEPAVKPLTTPRTTVEVTAYEALHVRQHPTTAAAVIGYLYNSDPVTLTGTCSTDPAGWAEIAWHGGTAWVKASFLSDNNCLTNKE